MCVCVSVQVGSFSLDQDEDAATARTALRSGVRRCQDSEQLHRQEQTAADLI